MLAWPVTCWKIFPCILRSWIKRTPFYWSCYKAPLDFPWKTRPLQWGGSLSCFYGRIALQWLHCEFWKVLRAPLFLRWELFKVFALAWHQRKYMIWNVSLPENQASCVDAIELTRKLSAKLRHWISDKRSNGKQKPRSFFSYLLSIVLYIPGKSHIPNMIKRKRNVKREREVQTQSPEETSLCDISHFGEAKMY